MAKKINTETKYNFVMRYINGETSTKLTKELNLSNNLCSSQRMFYKWIYDYKSKGIYGLMDKRETKKYFGKKPDDEKSKNKKIDYSKYTKKELIEIIKVFDLIEDWIENDKNNKKKKFACIHWLKTEIKISLSYEKICSLLLVSLSGYKKWKHKMEIGNKYNSEWLDLIKEIFEKYNGVYGKLRIKKILEIEYKLNINIKTVAKYMHKIGISSKIRRKSKCRETKVTNRKFDNLINKNFIAKSKNEKWFLDVSYIYTNQGWKYLVAIIDSYNNEIIAWELLNQQTDLAICSLLEETLINENSKPIIHTDHHAIFYGKRYIDLSFKYGFKVSKGVIGDSLSNRPIEYFFSILKSECLKWLPPSKKDVDMITNEIESFIAYYNSIRFQSCLQWKAPIFYSKDYT